VPVNLTVCTLIDAHRQDRDVDACIAVLSPTSGTRPRPTRNRYLMVTPALADDVSPAAPRCRPGFRPDFPRRDFGAGLPSLSDYGCLELS
jgi:hypothetical protein